MPHNAGQSSTDATLLDWISPTPQVRMSASLHHWVPVKHVTKGDDGPRHQNPWCEMHAGFYRTRRPRHLSSTVTDFQLNVETYLWTTFSLVKSSFVFREICPYAARYTKALQLCRLMPKNALRFFDRRPTRIYNPLY